MDTPGAACGLPGEGQRAARCAWPAVKGGARRADVFPLVEGVWHRQQEDGGLHLVVKVSPQVQGPVPQPSSALLPALEGPEGQGPASLLALQLGGRVGC